MENQINLEPSSTIQVQKFDRRPGTQNDGDEYEYTMCSLFALLCLLNDTISDFEMTTNQKDRGAFDDLSLKINFNDNTEKTIFFQFKHKKNSKKPVRQNNLESTSSNNQNFSLLKYLKSFEGLNVEDNFLYILYTNASFASQIPPSFDIPFTEKIQSYNFTKIFTDHKKLLVKVNRSSSQSSPIDFLFPSNIEKNNNAQTIQFTINADSKNAVCQKFSQQFFFFSNQYSLKHVRDMLVPKILFQLCDNHILQSVLNFIRSWWKKSIVLTKDILISKLVELTLSPYARKISEKYANKKTEYLENSIKSYDLAFVGQCKMNNCTVKTCNNNIIENIWKVTSENENKNEIAKLYDLSKSSNKDDDNLILWHLNEIPLIVEVNEKNTNEVELSIKLLSKCTIKKKVVLICDESKVNEIYKKMQNATKNPLRGLSDLINKEEILEEFKISLQEGQTMSLRQLTTLCPQLTEAIGLKDLLEMTQTECLNVGSKTDDESTRIDSYIKSTLLRMSINTKKILNYCINSQNCILILNCDDDETTFKTKFDARNTPVMKFDPALKVRFKNFVLLSPQKCTMNEFDKICEKYPLYDIYLIQVVDEENSCLILSKGESLPLVKQNEEGYDQQTEVITFNEEAVSEENIFHNFKDSLNVICAPAGMGKSTLLKQLSGRYCPPNFWSLHIDLIKQNLFFDSKPDKSKILDHFWELNTTSTLERKMKKVFLEQRKVLIFLDGLDEVDNRYLDSVLDFIKSLISEGLIVWVTSRENLSHKIAQLLYTVPVKIQGIDERSQKVYIEDRLKGGGKAELLSSMSLNNFQELLNTPLHLYIFTEICLNNPTLYEQLAEKNIYSLTNLYKLFFEGKKKILWEKIDLDKLLSGAKIYLRIYFYTFFKQYELPALQCCLEDIIFKKLQLPITAEAFLEEISENGDPSGIIKNIKNGQVFFDQYTYAEYFASIWLTNEQTKTRLLREELLSNKYINLKRMLDLILAEETPLHVAVIYNNLTNFNDCFSKFLTTKDKGGRSALHVASTYGIKYPKGFERLDRENNTYVKIFKRLLSESESVTEPDELFRFSCVEYAIKSRCLYPVEKMLTLKKIDFNYVENLIYDHFTKDELAYYSAQMGYLHILTAIIQKNSKFVNDIFGDLPLLGVAVVGAKNDSVLKSREANLLVIKYLLENGAKVNGLSYYSQRSILDHACENKCYDTLEILIKRGAKCTEGNTVLHRVIEFGPLNENVIDLCGDVNAQNDNGVTALHLACQSGQTENVEELLKIGGEVNIIDHDHRNTLHYAIQAQGENLPVIRLLLKHGVEVNAQDVEGITPLHTACNKMKPQVAEFLLDNDANIKLEDKVKMNILHYAAQSNRENTKIIKCLVEKGIDVNARNIYGSPALHHACKRGQVENAKTLFDLGAEINLVNENGISALQYAIQSWNKCPKLVNFLLQNNADVTIKNQSGFTALHIECKSGLVENVTLLIGDNANLCDNEGKSLLHYAAMSRKDGTQKIDLLLKHGIDVDVKDANGQTPLHAACAYGRDESILHLLRSNADGCIVDSKGMTALHYVVKTKTENNEIIQHLINKITDINRKNEKGATMLHTACERRKIGIVKELLSVEKIDVNIVNDKKRTALHCSVNSKKQNPEIVELLLERQTDLNAQDENGHTALHLACKRGHLESVKAILEKGANPDIQDNENLTALHCAVQGKGENVKMEMSDFQVVKFNPPEEYSEILVLLLNNGATADARTKSGATALHLLCEQEQTNDVKLLLPRVAAVNSVDSRNMNALHYAAKSWIQNEEIINLLLEHDFDVNVQDDDGNTVLHFLCERGEIKIVKKLLQRHADVNCKNSQGMNALHCAVHLWKPNTELIELLVRQGVDFNAQNENDMTALHFLCKKGEVQNVRRLLEAGANPNLLDNRNMDALCYAHELVLLVEANLAMNLSQGAHFYNHNFNTSKVLEVKSLIADFYVVEIYKDVATWITEENSLT